MFQARFSATAARRVTGEFGLPRSHKIIDLLGYRKSRFIEKIKFRWRLCRIQVTEFEGRSTNDPKLGALGVLGGEK